MSINERRRGDWPGRYSGWRPWFAWRPVRLGGHGRLAWLRTIRRRWFTYYEVDMGAVPAPADRLGVPRMTHRPTPPYQHQ